MFMLWSILSIVFAMLLWHDIQNEYMGWVIFDVIALLLCMYNIIREWNKDD